MHYNAPQKDQKEIPLYELNNDRGNSVLQQKDWLHLLGHRMAQVNEQIQMIKSR